MSRFSNTLIDNSSEELRLVKNLKNMISSGEFNHIRIATGYWDLPGMSLIYDELKAFLEEGGRLDIMIGKEPQLRSYQLRDEYQKQPFPDFNIKQDVDKLSDEYIDVAQLLLKYCEVGEQEPNSQIQIRVYGQDKTEEQFLHAKCYIFLRDKDASHRGDANAILGSSNFTQKGLEGNAELNYLETNNMIVTAVPNEYSSAKGHKKWFEEKWDESVAWNGKFIMDILLQSPVGKKAAEKQQPDDMTDAEPDPFTPYELYIKLLQIKFGDIVDKTLGQQIETYLPTNFHKLEYQIEAVKRCIGIMHEHGGFMLADVVGLGKTIIGTLIIKRFLTVPEDDGRERKVLVITPPAIQSAWKKTIATFDNDSDDKIETKIDFITTGRIENVVEDDDEDDDNGDSGEFCETLQDKDYGLIIIDESHKFRNSNTYMYQLLDDLIQKIASNTGFTPYIGLLSATPQNNRPNDLKNQIYLFERNHNDSTLKKAESGNIERFFADVNREYDLLIKRNSDIPKEERKRRLDELSKKIRDCILSDILERRTRTDVEKYYKEDMQSQGLVFPKIIGPNNLEYIMDKELAKLFSDTMTIIAPTAEEKLHTDEWLGYLRYRAIEYFVDKENEKKHTGRGDRGVSNVADQLASIMQILLVKRLESSFTAFTQSLLNLRQYTANMIDMWENDTIFICPQINVNKELDIEAKSEKRGKRVTFEDCVKDIRSKINKLTEQGKNDKGQNAEYRRTDFKEEYIELLKEDYRLISLLCDRWGKNSQDPKFDTFKENLRSELFNPEKNTSRKLVIFSEAIDTVRSLARAVEAKGYRALVITAANRDDMEQTIEENFDANYEGEWKNDYDVIITTEVLAEGVNLHRANVILNYDTPWNSTRLMQRIGRVNRIGGKEPYVYVYNFLPSAEGDSQIQLVRKAHNKLQSFHVLFGEDSKIFSDEEDVVHYDLQKAVDGEESPLEKYVHELKQYKETHPERYSQIEDANDDWQMAQAESGNAYFIIKAPRSARLAVKISQDENGQRTSQIISLLELLEDMRVDENAKRIPLPSHWPELSAEAIKTYNQYFVRINKSRAGDKRTQALEIIVNLYNREDISAQSKELLKYARRLADKGSFDIIKKMLAIGQELEERESRLFAIEQQDIDDILEREIGKLVANVESKQGEAAIILGTIK